MAILMAIYVGTLIIILMKNLIGIVIGILMGILIGIVMEHVHGFFFMVIRMKNSD